MSLGKKKKKTSRRNFKLIRNPLLSLCPRASDQYPWWHGNRPVWNDWPADVHPGSRDRPRHGPPGAGLRPHHTWPQPQLAWVRVAHANAIYSWRQAASLKFVFFEWPQQQLNDLSLFSHSDPLSLPLSVRNLYPKFASPWASAPCRPQDIGEFNTNLEVVTEATSTLNAFSFSPRFGLPSTLRPCFSLKENAVF